MSTHNISTLNIGFYEDLTKIIIELSSNMHLISSADHAYIHLTKFPTLPVIFSIYLKTDVLDFFEILWLSRTINLQNAFQFSGESACKICKYSIFII